MEERSIRSCEDRRIKPLILARDPAWQGGVRNIVETMVAHFSPNVAPIELRVGQRIGRSSAARRVLFALGDSIRLAITVMARDVSLVHLNPSLDRRSLMRDGLFLVMLKLVRFRRTVVFFHGWDHAIESRVRRSAGFRRLFRWVFGGAGIILVLGTRFKASLVQMGFVAEKVRVVSAMFDGRMFSGPRHTVTRSAEKRVVSMSRLTKEKGVYELLEAFESVSKRFPDATLSMAGDGPERDAIEMWIRKRNLGSKIRLPGYVRGEDKAAVLNKADVFVLPTYHGEGCPVALLEAMAAGLAVITTAVGGIPDVFADGENGVLLHEVSAEAIEKAIEKVFRDSAFCRRVCDTNREKAWSNYEAAIVTRTIEGIYREVMG
jgi:glycosyltransferase involved in cell wall biosynthesis